VQSATGGHTVHGSRRFDVERCGPLGQEKQIVCALGLWLYSMGYLGTPYIFRKKRRGPGGLDIGTPYIFPRVSRGLTSVRLR